MFCIFGNWNSGLSRHTVFDNSQRLIQIIALFDELEKQTLFVRKYTVLNLGNFGHWKVVHKDKNW